MAFDFKKEYKEYYMPKNTPEIVNVPKANYLAVRGKGDPNEEDGAYQKAISVLYAVAYTLKMSYKTDYKIKGYFEYVVPPLEGFWWQDSIDGIDYAEKSAFNWISVIRLPDFVSENDFQWAVGTATKYAREDHVHPTDTSRATKADFTSFTITLASASWSSNAQTVSNANFIASGYAYIVSPASASFSDYGNAQIYADDVTTDGSMTFHCTSAPSTNLTVNIARVVASRV